MSEWFDPSAVISNSKKITDIFGYWPTFHDAEIHELRLSIDSSNPEVYGSNAPVLNMSIHLWEMTKEVNAEGYFILDKHTLAHLRFKSVEDVVLKHFSHQNCIFELIFGIEPMALPSAAGVSADSIQRRITVTIDSSAGLEGAFKCFSAEVISADLCDEDGNILG